MAKYKVSELEGRQLDEAVAIADGWRRSPRDPSAWLPPRPQMNLKILGDEVGWRPSRAWEHGGPIIERERIELRNDASGGWNCMGNGCYGDGPTPLIAAMRAYVASKVGAEVELP